MSKFNDPGNPGARMDGSGSGPPGRSRRRAAAVVTSLAVAGGVLLTTQLVDSPGAGAYAHGAAPKALAASTPPAGSTWVEGVITDQAGTGQDDVNVEAWPMEPATGPSASALTYGGPAASALTYGGPAASGLTYGGPRYNAAQGHGFFRLEVPSNQAYRIVFSAVNGQEDGDPFRMMWYGSDRPIMVRMAAKVAAVPLPAGRIRDLGTIQLARQGQVASTTTAVARPAKVRGAKRGKVRVTVSSTYVTDVTGQIVVKVAGHQVKRNLTTADHGTRMIKLPKLRHAGKYRVRVHFTGTSTVQSSKAKPVKVKVVRK
jgi:hypothetical protein